jgi:membrane protease YdiL (CAAX protease family)
MSDEATKKLVRQAGFLNGYLLSPLGVYPFLVILRESIFGFRSFSLFWFGEHARDSFLETGSIGMALAFILAFCAGYVAFYVSGRLRLLLVVLLSALASTMYFGILYIDVRLTLDASNHCGNRDGVPYCMSYFETGLVMFVSLNLSISGCRWAFERFAAQTYSWRAPTQKQLKQAGAFQGGLPLDSVHGIIHWAVRFIVAAVAAAFFIVLVAILVKVPQTPTFDLALKAVAALVAQAVLFAAAIAAGRAIGNGNVSSGLGNAPISHPRLIFLMGVALVAYGALATYVLYIVRPDLLAEDYPAVSPWLLLLFALLAIVVAPCAEELFFRGWLWTGLRRHWHIIPTLSLTAAFWLVLHIDPTNLLRSAIIVPALIPGAAILSMARELGGSVRAPIAIHAVYNFVVIGLGFFLVR